MDDKLPGFDQNYIYRLLGSYWQQYRERDQLATFWGGTVQVIDDMYLQTYQADFSKSLNTVPLYWRYMWINFEFGDWETNDVFHKHKWYLWNIYYEYTTVGGETIFPISTQYPAGTAIDPRNVKVMLDGVVQVEGIDYTFPAARTVQFREALTAGRNLMIQWQEEKDLVFPRDFHYHRSFEEVLVVPKDTWTDTIGDAFENDPPGPGPYQPNDGEAQIEIWVNGVKQPKNLYEETDSVTFKLNVADTEVGDWVVLRWTRTPQVPNYHVHYKYVCSVASAILQFFRPPFTIDGTTKREEVFVNGVMLRRGADYTVLQSGVVEIVVPLVRGDLVEIEYWKPEFKYRHELDSKIISIPYLQDGIDKPTIVSKQGVDHELRLDNYIYSNYNIADAWVPNVYTNEEVIRDNFGLPLNFVRHNESSYLFGTRGLWYVHWHGPAVDNIALGGRVMMGVPYAPITTTVKTVLDGELGSKIITLANGSTYQIYPPLTCLVNAGDSVQAYQPLADGLWVWDWINNPDWWKYLPGFRTLWSLFSTTGTTWTGRFDDRGHFDDGGYLDDAGANQYDDEKAFDLIKYFLFVVVVNSSLVTNFQNGTDLTFFVDTIKPAYTDYIAVIDQTPIRDEFVRKAADVVTLDLT
jgi:hypothetical protein